MQEIQIKKKGFKGDKVEKPDTQFRSIFRLRWYS